jgi:hypothetical protein
MTPAGAAISRKRQRSDITVRLILLFANDVISKKTKGACIARRKITKRLLSHPSDETGFERIVVSDNNTKLKITDIIILAYNRLILSVWTGGIILISSTGINANIIPEMTGITETSVITIRE